MKQDFKIRKYSLSDKTLWDSFAAQCMQQHFFFQRSFMEYHKERFTDASLIVEDMNDNIVALFPASVKDNTVSSHAGLTFGGLLYKKRTFVQKIVTILSLIERYYQELGIEKITYKVMPYIYKSEQGEEDLYALYRNEWKLVRRDFSTIIKKDTPFIPDRSRRKNNTIALNSGVQILPSNDLSTFWELLNSNLQSKHSVKPTHSLAELQFLMQLFPDNIKLIGGFEDGEMLSGALLFLTPNVCKIQYSVNSLRGREFKVLDAIFLSIINDNQLPYIDFGHSSENDGKYLNGGLSKFKFYFNGEASVCDFYEKDLTANL
ncbi:GNAT family N-acetyltransferase [Flammeovirga aprica]|uniref:GNAT family N-acetyltransferase n=1 Tax=Flammeovirga aprica JL-4 TaxID=694437 RepID=A0A7X9RWQ8_9BACT|nr:GNAT family N-acetyltransferase [Flammeovirga aprica]NME70099.1 GNAT family N-acetyltransferase [Flammeovirga aprica JL-4]